LICIVRHGVAAQAQGSVAYLPLKMANNGLERHPDFCHVLHDHLGEHQFREGGALVHLAPYLGLRLPQKFRQFHT
jgi:hypothetical protein